MGLLPFNKIELLLEDDEDEDDEEDEDEEERGRRRRRGGGEEEEMSRRGGGGRSHYHIGFLQVTYRNIVLSIPSKHLLPSDGGAWG